MKHFFSSDIKTHFASRNSSSVIFSCAGSVRHVAVGLNVTCVMRFDFKPWGFSGSWDHSLTLPPAKLKSHPWAGG